jgi:hypothetical protein
MTHAKTVAMVWGSEPPAFSIGYEREKLWPGDSGFTVLFDDAPEPDDLPDAGDDPPEGITVVCLHCLLDDHPEIGRGLDIAREYGVADLDENGVWVVGDLSLA